MRCPWEAGVAERAAAVERGVTVLASARRSLASSTLNSCRGEGKVGEGKKASGSCGRGDKCGSVA